MKIKRTSIVIMVTQSILSFKTKSLVYEIRFNVHLIDGSNIWQVIHRVLELVIALERLLFYMRSAALFLFTF